VERISNIQYIIHLQLECREGVGERDELVERPLARVGLGVGGEGEDADAVCVGQVARPSRKRARHALRDAREALLGKQGCRCL